MSSQVGRLSDRRRRRRRRPHRPCLPRRRPLVVVKKVIEGKFPAIRTFTSASMTGDGAGKVDGKLKGRQWWQMRREEDGKKVDRSRRLARQDLVAEP